MVGPFGNMFPYTNFHDINLDWMIGIIRDFLEKYSSIEEAIQTGKDELDAQTAADIAELTAKKDEVIRLMNAWYTTHSAEMAADLARAIDDFNTAADAKAANTLASIPDDYTTLANNVSAITNEVNNNVILTTVRKNLSRLMSFVRGTIGPDGEEAPYVNRIRTDFIDVSAFEKFICTVNSGYKYDFAWYDANKNFINGSAWQTTDATITPPANTVYCRFLVADTSDGDASLSYQRQVVVYGQYKSNKYAEANEYIRNLEGSTDYDVIAGSWIGGYWYSNGSVTSAAEQPNYVCTQAIQRFPFAVVITPDPGYQIIVRTWNDAETSLTGTTDWIRRSEFLPANVPFVINLSKTTPEEVTDVDEYVSHIHIRSYASYDNAPVPAQQTVKMAVLGDSISSYSGVSEASYNYYPTGNITNESMMWWSIVGKKLNAESIAVSAISRTAFYDIQESGRTPMYDDDRITRLGSEGDPSIIFVMAGVNDGFVNQTATIDYTMDISDLEALANSTMKGIALTIRKLQVAYPDAKIVMLIPEQVNYSAMVTGYTPERTSKIADYIKTYAEMYGAWKVIDLRKCGITQDNASVMYGDGSIHPKVNGMRAIAEYIIQNLD